MTRNWCLSLRIQPGNQLSYTWETYTEFDGESYPEGVLACKVNPPIMYQGDQLLVIFHYDVEENGEVVDVVKPSGIQISYQNQAIIDHDLPSGGGTDLDGSGCYWGPITIEQSTDGETEHFTVQVTCTPQGGGPDEIYRRDPEMVVKTKEGEEPPG